MNSDANIIRERATRLFAKAAAAREQGKIEHAIKFAKLASHIMNEAEAAEATLPNCNRSRTVGFRGD